MSDRLDEAKAALAVASASGTVWRHRKTGHLYMVWGHCVIEATLTPAILYTRWPERDVFWVRPLTEFLDGRFE
jgi:hypothetical protein